MRVVLLSGAARGWCLRTCARPSARPSSHPQQFRQVAVMQAVQCRSGVTTRSGAALPSLCHVPGWHAAASWQGPQQLQARQQLQRRLTAAAAAGSEGGHCCQLHHQQQLNIGARPSPAILHPHQRHSSSTAAAATDAAAAAAVAGTEPAADTLAAAAAAAVAAAPAEQLGDLRSKLTLFNTMTRQKEVFTPRAQLGDKVQMYVCGVTVYDYSHIGHARVYVAFDVLYRLLRYLRYDVQYVRNFTDIDDKIIARAAQSGEDPLALSARFIEEYHADMAALGCLRPTSEPKATEYIPQMISTIQDIIDNGHAYALPDGDVYFDVASLPGYGRLSGRKEDDNRAGERVAVDHRKRHPSDFALWKSSKPGEPAWDSPWGAGRPGWHIECSSMIRELMGPVIDIHGGGRDLVFPHHENELAQSQAACGCCDKEHLHQGTDFVRYWVHNGFVNVDSEKMSKSLGNFFTIRDVLARYHPLALRWFLVCSQYRAPLNYSSRGLEEASDKVFYLLQTLEDVEGALSGAGAAGQEALTAAAAELAGGVGPAAELRGSLLSALLDDLNTPGAVAALVGPAGPLKVANDLLGTKAGRKNPKRLQLLAGALLGLRCGAGLLGLELGHPPAAALAQLRELALVRAGLSEEQVQQQIAARAAARASKDFAAGDAIRQQLEGVGVWLMDAPGGTTWRPGLPAEQQQ